MSDDTLDLEDLKRINLTQAVRENIITQLTKNNKIPDENSDRTFLIAALDGMDRCVYSKAKIKSQDKLNNDQSHTLTMLSQLLYKINSNPPTQPSFRKLDTVYKVDDLMPGETDQGIQHLDSDDFF